MEYAFKLQAVLDTHRVVNVIEDNARPVDMTFSWTITANTVEIKIYPVDFAMPN